MALETVILTPFRATPQRERVWRFVQAWIATNYGFRHVVADSIGKVFSAAQARNNAARDAGRWDVAIIHDSDTIAHPDAITEAITLACESNMMVVTADSHMYCDRPSSERILWSGVPMFARPESFTDTHIYRNPCSGVFAINRDTWNAVGGYVEDLAGWGFEDLVFLQACGIFAGGHTWIPNHINLHLWHPPADKTDDTNRNRVVWQTLAKFRRRNDPQGAKEYLASLGHHIP